MPLQRLTQPLEGGLAAEFGVERVMIDDVVAVGAALAGFQERRRIEMADAQRLEIRHDRGRCIEIEVGRQLYATRCGGDGGRHYLGPMYQCIAHGETVAYKSLPLI